MAYKLKTPKGVPYRSFKPKSGKRGKGAPKSYLRYAARSRTESR